VSLKAGDVVRIMVYRRWRWAMVLAVMGTRALVHYSLDDDLAPDGKSGKVFINTSAGIPGPVVAPGLVGNVLHYHFHDRCAWITEEWRAAIEAQRSGK
jgi:hypothetical protein